MRKIICVNLLMLFLGIGYAYARDVRVGGYIRKNGTYVQPHIRTTPNSSYFDNYSTKGNVNPYTGQTGHVNPDPSFSSYGGRFGQPSKSKRINSFLGY